MMAKFTRVAQKHKSGARATSHKHNASGEALESVYGPTYMQWTPPNKTPRPSHLPAVPAINEDATCSYLKYFFPFTKHEEKPKIENLIIPNEWKSHKQSREDEICPIGRVYEGEEDMHARQAWEILKKWAG